MKVAHVPFTFAPDPVGGTEIYIQGLARELRAHGIESLIVAPSQSGMDESYEHDGLRVRRFRSVPNSRSMLRELYGAGDPEAAAAFARILDDERPDAVHIHAFTRAVSIRLVRAAKQRNLPTLFTYHTPAVSCQRGTLMNLGTQPCDGLLEDRRCAVCSLESRKLPHWLSILLSFMPSQLVLFFERANFRGSFWTLLQTRGLVQARHQAFHTMMREVDAVVALSEWTKNLLVQNGVATSKITFSRHGFSGQEGADSLPINITSTPLRVAFFGRADPAKGADTLIKAVRAAPALNIALHLYGVTQSAGDDAYWATLKHLAETDSRIVFLPSVAHHRVIQLLRTYHIVAVPSRCCETGPLIVLESLAAGTPVVGSNLGGISEWVRHHENGLLVDFAHTGAWTDVLRQCAENRATLARLRQGVRLPRKMAGVAADMAALYRRTILLNERAPSDFGTFGHT